MKKLIVYLVFSIICLSGYTQKLLTDGTYTTSDGLYSITIEFKKDSIRLVEPNKVSIYSSVGNNIYKFVNPKNGVDYRIEVLDSKTFASYKNIRPAERTIISLNEGINDTEMSDSAEHFLKLAEKYLDKSAKDPDNLQLWTFCSSAASMRAVLNKKGFEETISKHIKALKEIMIDRSKCPCEDVIPIELWKSVN